MEYRNKFHIFLIQLTHSTTFMRVLLRIIPQAKVPMHQEMGTGPSLYDSSIPSHWTYELLEQEYTLTIIVD